MFDKNHLGHNFEKYKSSYADLYMDDFICLNCNIRVEYDGIQNTYSEVTDETLSSIDEILNCTEQKIKNLLE